MFNHNTESGLVLHLPTLSFQLHTYNLPVFMHIFFLCKTQYDAIFERDPKKSINGLGQFFAH